MILNYGQRLKEFAYRPLDLDRRINILEGSVRSGKTWALHPKILQGCRYPVKGWRVLTGVGRAEWICIKLPRALEGDVRGS